jgi:hypothetical protein
MPLNVYTFTAITITRNRLIRSRILQHTSYCPLAMLETVSKARAIVTCDVYACNETDMMHHISSVYSVTIPPHVSGLLIAHHRR